MKYDWVDAEARLFKELDLGDFNEPDQMPDWSRQADAEKMILQYMADRLDGDKGPSTSTVRGWIVPAVERWRERKVTKASNSK